MITLSTADNALKDVYLGVVANQLNNSINPLLAKINHTSADVWGKEIRKVAPHGMNGGIGAGTEDGNLPMAAPTEYAQFVLPLKNLYGNIEISDKALRASEHSNSAFINILNSEMENLIKSSTFNMGRMLYGDGTGILTTVFDSTTTYLEVTNTDKLLDNMVLDVIGDDETPIYAKIRIKYIDRVNNKVYFYGSPFRSNNELLETNYNITMQNSYKNELTGLGAVFQSTGSIYGLDRTSNTWLTPYMKDHASADITENAMQKAIDELDEISNSKVDFIVCSSGVKRNYQAYLASYRSNIDVLNLEGGFKAISYNGIPVVSDRFCPAKTMYLLNTSDIHMHQLCDWNWLESEDGRVIKQTPGKATYQATLVKYADMVCDRPAGQAKISNIKES